jgi:hypothetical protein
MIAFADFENTSQRSFNKYEGTKTKKIKIPKQI